MTQQVLDAKTWAAGVLFLGLAGYLGYTLPHPEAMRGSEPPPTAAQVGKSKPANASASEPRPQHAAFQPQDESRIPDNGFGEMVRLGQRIFEDTAANAPGFVGNDLRCANCHLDRGRLANAAPLWAAFVAFPAYRDKNRHVNTFAERLQGCFRFSMNGKAPALGDKILVALESYAAFLAKGAPSGESLPGRGYPKLSPAAKLDLAHGQQVYGEKCALCHGAKGEGQATADGHVAFPPLWGPRSYNWGAGMSVISNAAGFIKANMPLSQGNSLTDQEAWDVAAYIDSQERPQDPRFEGSVAETRKAHHDSPLDMYGQSVSGVVLGEASPPFGTIPK